MGCGAEASSSCLSIHEQEGSNRLKSRAHPNHLAGDRIRQRIGRVLLGRVSCVLGKVWRLSAGGTHTEKLECRALLDLSVGELDAVRTHSSEHSVVVILLGIRKDR